MAKLKMINVFLFLIFVFAQLSFGTTDQYCESGPINDAFYYVKRGIDFTIKDVDDMDECCKPMMTYSCNQNKTFNFPNSTEIYNLPDQVIEIKFFPNKKTNKSSIIYDKLSSFKQSILSHVKVEKEFALGQSSTDKRYEIVQNLFLNSDYFIANVSIFIHFKSHFNLKFDDL